MMMKKILIDTHILIWMITASDKLSKEAVELIQQAVPERRMLLSAISLLEITMLVQKKRLQFSTPVRMWLERALTTPGLSLVPLSPKVLIESCLLPGKVHGDPADQMILATARIENATLVTRDQNIIKYAKSQKMAYIKG